MSIQKITYNPLTGLLNIKTWEVRGYLQCWFEGKNQYVHRVAWFLHTGKWPEKTIDHIDGNPHNNKWDNLREATMKEQSANRSKRSNNTSGHKGVSKSGNKWRVRINGISFGSHSDFELACLVADEAQAKLYGEFAKETK